MPSKYSIAIEKNLKDYKGNLLNACDVIAGEFDRGHVVPKSKGGLNSELELQPSKSNKQYGNIPL